jgi:predicted dinucleotide-binding enzyme
VSTTHESTLTVAVLGAGVVGRTLATGWARAGHHVVLGSRDPASNRTRDAVAEIAGTSGGQVSANGHADAAAAADAVVVTVPGDQVPWLIAQLGSALAGRIVVDATNHVAPGAAAMNAVAALGEAGAAVYRAFNTVGWEQMQQPVFGQIRSDMPYAGAADGKNGPIVERLIADIGFRPIRLGDDDRALEAVDALARLWFLLAFGQGYGRRLGLRFLTQDDDAPQ